MSFGELIDRALSWGALAAAVLLGFLAEPIGLSKPLVAGLAGALGALVGTWWAFRIFRPMSSSAEPEDHQPWTPRRRHRHALVPEGDGFRCVTCDQPFTAGGLPIQKPRPR